MKEPVKKWVSKILLKMGGKGRGDQRKKNKKNLEVALRGEE